MTYGKYPDLSKVKKILIVKLRHHGDVLLTSPVFSCLQQALPHASIDALLYQDTLPMLEGHPAVSRFILYDKKWKKLPLLRRIYREISLYRQVARGGYDLVINLTEGDRGAFAAMISKAFCTVGFDRGGKRLLGRKKVYDYVVKSPGMPRHTVERQLDAIRCIGIFPKEEQRDLFLHVPQSCEKAVDLLLQRKDYVVIHPVSRWRFKCLAPEAMGALIAELVMQGHHVVLTAGVDPEEKQMIEAIKAHAPFEGVTDLSGKTTLKELAALIKNAQFVVCVDSVPLHIASALKTPVVAIFGPTSELNWGPWMHPAARVVTKNMSCRPCFRDGCAGSKMSDCLFTLSIHSILSAIDMVRKEGEPLKLPSRRP